MLSRRKAYSQNFLWNSKLAEKIVRQSRIAESDFIVEIGCGSGIITEVLCKAAKPVLAIEIDSVLAQGAQLKLRHFGNLQILNADFLSVPLPDRTYSVFSNVPFSIGMAVVRKLLDAKNPPENACLILPRFLVNRLIGEPKQTGLSVLYGPFFQFTKICRLQPTDFRPIPSVDSDLIKISKRASPLISWKERSSYTHFIKAGFLHGDAVDRNLQKLYPKETIKAVFSKHGIGRDTLPNRLSLVLWLRLYQALGTQA